jgi:hypothetical protein
MPDDEVEANELAPSHLDGLLSQSYQSDCVVPSAAISSNRSSRGATSNRLATISGLRILALRALSCGLKTSASKGGTHAAAFDLFCRRPGVVVRHSWSNTCFSILPRLSRLPLRLPLRRSPLLRLSSRLSSLLVAQWPPTLSLVLISPTSFTLKRAAARAAALSFWPEARTIARISF